MQVACYPGRAWKSDKAKPIEETRSSDEAQQIDTAPTSDPPKPSSNDVRFDAMEKCSGDEPVKIAGDNVPYQRPRRV